MVWFWFWVFGYFFFFFGLKANTSPEMGGEKRNPNALLNHVATIVVSAKSRYRNCSKYCGYVVFLFKMLDSLELNL